MTAELRRDAVAAMTFLLERPRAGANSARETTLPSRANPSGTPPTILTRRGLPTTGDAAKSLLPRIFSPPVHPAADAILEGGNRANDKSPQATTFHSRADPLGTPPAILTRRGSATTGDAARQTRLFGRGNYPTVNPPADTILDGCNRASDAYYHNHEEGVGNHERRGEVAFAADILPPGAPTGRRHS